MCTQTLLFSHRHMIDIAIENSMQLYHTHLHLVNCPTKWSLQCTYLHQENRERVLEVTGLGIMWGFQRGKGEAGNQKGDLHVRPIQNISKTRNRSFCCLWCSWQWLQSREWWFSLNLILEEEILSEITSKFLLLLLLLLRLLHLFLPS